MKSNKFWLLLFGAILALCAAAGALLFFGGRTEAMTAEILQDGVCIQSIDLTRVEQPYTLRLEWEGGYNVVEVERGRVRVSEADCPDQICVRQGWISHGAVPIACLPHRLVIRLTGSPGAPVDAAAG